MYLWVLELSAATSPRTPRTCTPLPAATSLRLPSTSPERPSLAQTWATMNPGTHLTEESSSSMSAESPHKNTPRSLPCVPRNSSADTRHVQRCFLNGPPRSSPGSRRGSPAGSFRSQQPPHGSPSKVLSRSSPGSPRCSEAQRMSRLGISFCGLLGSRLQLQLQEQMTREQLQLLQAEVDAFAVASGEKKRSHAHDAQRRPSSLCVKPGWRSEADTVVLVKGESKKPRIHEAVQRMCSSLKGPPGIAYVASPLRRQIRSSQPAELDGARAIPQLGPTRNTSLLDHLQNQHQEPEQTSSFNPHPASTMVIPPLTAASATLPVQTATQLRPVDMSQASGPNSNFRRSAAEASSSDVATFHEAMRSHQPLQAFSTQTQAAAVHSKTMKGNAKANGQQSATLFCADGHAMIRIPADQQDGKIWICNGCERKSMELSDSARFQCASCDFDLCDTCASKLQSPVSCPVRCPKSHVLTIRSPAKEQARAWICDGCERETERSDDVGSFHCGQCDYDLCCVCISRLRRPKATWATGLRCPRDHMLMITTAESQDQPWRCDSCEHKSDVSPGVGCFRCAPCGYDLCEACVARRQCPLSSSFQRTLRCPHGHRLLISLATSLPWSCGSCSKGSGWQTGALRYTCLRCGYDRCEACRTSSQHSPDVILQNWPGSSSVRPAPPGPCC